MTSTAIESKLIREGGTIIPMEGHTYHFTPYTDGAHVCEVDKTEHIDRFLAIPEGYRLYRGVGLPLGPLSAPAFQAAVAHAQAQEEAPVLEPAAAPAPAPAAAPEILLGGDYPANITIHGETYSLGVIVARAQGASNLSIHAWNEQPQGMRDALIENELNAIDEAGPATPPAAEAPAAEAPPAVDHDAERAALVAEYTTLVGKKPHYNVGIEKLRHILDAERENAAKHLAEAAKQP